MSKNNLIQLRCFNREIGKIGFDENRNASFFQYDPSFLNEGIYKNMFPLIIRRIPQTQVFDKYFNDTFRCLPPMIADSLPDVFGNVIFKAWLDNAGVSNKKISVIEQLTYVGARGMGALEYWPAQEIRGSSTINIDEIVDVVEQVLKVKKDTINKTLNTEALFNIFKMGTSAGGVRPKILISQHKVTGETMAGDLVYSNDYEHYLVKLGIDDGLSYSREAIEYAYYLTAISVGITMMQSKLIDGKHFATLRFDRQHGKKMHTLTATGIAGLDYKDATVSSYEQLFDLCIYLKLSYVDIEALFTRMAFNWVFANFDDHLKNHSFIYDKIGDCWSLAPAYDLTYSLNPELHFNRVSRALSINGKRIDIEMNDLLAVAEKYAIKNPTGILHKMVNAIPQWEAYANELGIPSKIIAIIKSDFKGDD